MSNIDIKIPEEIWEDASDSGSTGFTAPPDLNLARTRLYASIHINGVLFHCEAIEATYGEEGDGLFKAVNPAWEESIGDYYQACGAEGPMNTITIAGRQYALFITPSCR